MIEKYENKIIKNVTEFRHLIAVYRASIEKNKLKRFISELNDFFDDKEKGIMDINVPGANYAKKIKEISVSSKRLFSQIQNIEIENISSDKSLIDRLQKLSQLINEKLEEAYLISPSSRTQED